MKIITTKAMANGRTVATVELEPGERLIGIMPGQHYKLGEPLDDVVAAHVLEAAVPVNWCSVGQEWVK